jgi:hypothetical protein
MANGRRYTVELLWMSAELYREPVVFASDLHKDFAAVLDVIEGEIEPQDWVFVSLGDMAGTERMGEAGDPTAEYLRIHHLFKKFYFVDGNHDRPRNEVYDLLNADGTLCCLQGSVGRIGDRTITGVSAILSRANRPGRMTRAVFKTAVEAALLEGPHTLATHEAPKVDGFKRPKGKELLTELVELIPPRVHAFGHCRLFPCFVQTERTLYLNTHGRFVLIRPE